MERPSCGASTPRDLPHFSFHKGRASLKCRLLNPFVRLAAHRAPRARRSGAAASMKTATQVTPKTAARQNISILGAWTESVAGASQTFSREIRGIHAFMGLGRSRSEDLLVAKRLDGIKTRSLEGGINARDHADTAGHDQRGDHSGQSRVRADQVIAELSH